MNKMEALREFRNRTGISLLTSKRLIEEADLDIDKAIDKARELGLMNFVPKSNSPANQGSVGIYVSPDGKLGAIVELLCQTDFAAKTQEFTETAYNVAKYFAETNDKLDEPSNGELSLMLDLLQSKIKETVILGRSEVFDSRETAT